jgi:SAM-dependent methyltransferase
MSKSPHSAPVLTDLRDQWWSADFLQLLITRLKLQECQSLADIGCGQGHWGQLLLRLLSPSAMLSGVDQEAEWVSKATLRATSLGLQDRCTYLEGKAAKLPFADGSFDLVTCQTLLMHVSEPKAVLQEMARVLRKGGRLLLLEPNNVAQQMIADTVNRALSAEQLAGVFALFSTCSRGRAKLGRGDDCIGDLLPSLLTDMDLTDIQVFQNERVHCIKPPYSAADLEQLEQSKGHAKKGFWLWDKADAQTLYEAGGGSPSSFAPHYAAFERRTALFEEQVDLGTYASNNASLHYIVCATK